MKKLKRIVPRLKPLADRIGIGVSWRADKRTANARGYNYEWQKARADHLEANPLCVMCYALGIIAAATVVDHKRPHRGDMVLFWDRRNWQSLCKTCHSKHKQRMEAHQ